MEKEKNGFQERWSKLLHMKTPFQGDYINARINKQRAETIRSVLIADDLSYQGKELHLKPQYFFVSASLQDIMWRFKGFHINIDDFPEKVVLQLNLHLRYLS